MYMMKSIKMNPKDLQDSVYDKWMEESDLECLLNAVENI
jgi:predicted transposase YbfD/YdcC